MMERHEIDRLRRVSLTDSTSSGAEAVRVSAQRRPILTAQTRQERREVMQTWERELGEKLSAHGGEVVPHSLSVAGQTVEAIVPIDSLPSVAAEMESGDVRLDVVAPRQVLDNPQGPGQTQALNSADGERHEAMSAGRSTSSTEKGYLAARRTARSGR